MATPNYNLPTISGNMTADVVRDVNALATATDGAIKAAVSSIDLTKIDQVDSRLTAHLEETKTSAHKAKNIALEDADGLFVGTELETAMKELFTNVSNGKVLIGTAITDIDDSKTVPLNPSFQQLADLIMGIDIGMRYAKGSIASSQTGKITVTGLGFLPRVIIYWSNSSKIGARSTHGIYVHSTVNPNSAFTVNFSINGSTYLDDAITSKQYGFEVNTGYAVGIFYSYIAFE